MGAPKVLPNPTTTPHLPLVRAARQVAAVHRIAHPAGAADAQNAHHHQVELASAKGREEVSAGEPSQVEFEGEDGKMRRGGMSKTRSSHIQCQWKGLGGWAV